MYILPSFDSQFGPQYETRVQTRTKRETNEYRDRCQEEIIGDLVATKHFIRVS